MKENQEKPLPKKKKPAEKKEKKELSLENIHWADHVAQKVIAVKGDKKKYTIASGITPSGTVHIGNFREIITTELVGRALRRLGKEVRFIYSWDDYDVFRKVPKNMPKQEMLQEYLRKPIVDTPDPFGCHESYARHHQIEIEETIPRVGITTEFIYQNKMYRACRYAEEMKHALQQKEKIRQILNKVKADGTELPETWLPISIFCEKCGRDTTKAEVYDGMYGVTYSCICGHKDTFDLRKKGISKLLWRIDWPMRWNYEKVDFEPGGKDHSSPGGSYDTGKEIVKLWKWEAPVYHMYDFVIVKGTGGKISSSAGNVVTLKDVLEVYEPEMVRWLFAGTRPNTEFAISFDLDVIKIYEDFDKCERMYYGEQAAGNEKELANQKRIYELSCVGEPSKKKPFQPSFRHLTNVLMCNNLNINKAIKYYEDQLNDPVDKQRLHRRAICAINWIKKYAPEDFKYELQEHVSPEVKARLSENQKKALRDVSRVLQERTWNDEDLHAEFYIIMKNYNLDTPQFFNAAYNVLINKNRGPKLAAFLLEIKDHAVSMFKEL
ncbi:lysine--tRNA ligase [Candidatus Woesearchaeota archaeon]|nr:lysine--tRNA ligase [Candidatus Woesearchaeota archaeon]